MCSEHQSPITAQCIDMVECLHCRLCILCRLFRLCRHCRLWRLILCFKEKQQRCNFTWDSHLPVNNKIRPISELVWSICKLQIFKNNHVLIQYFSIQLLLFDLHLIWWRKQLERYQCYIFTLVVLESKILLQEGEPIHLNFRKKECFAFFWLLHPVECP